MALITAPLAAAPENYSANLPDIAARFAGVLLVGASTATNLGYALSRAGDDPLSQGVLGSVAVAVSIGLATATAALFAALSQLDIGRTVLCTAAVVLFGGYSVSAALGSQGGLRMAADQHDADRAAAASRARRDYDTATRELDTFTPTKASSRARPEPGRAARQGELERRLAAASERLDALAASPTPANSDAKVIADFLEQLGADVTPDTVSRWLVILGVLVLEIGGGLCFAVAAAPRSRSKVVVSAPAETIAAIERPTADRIVELAKANGGRVPGSTRAVARMLNGVSKSTAHRAMSALLAGGVMVKSGGTISLAAGS